MSCEIKIDKGIPIPPTYQQRIKRIYPIFDMGVGDSFFVDSSEDDYNKKRSKINNFIIANRHKIGYETRFAIRKVEGGIRTWRTK